MLTPIRPLRSVVLLTCLAQFPLLRAQAPAKPPADNSQADEPASSTDAPSADTAWSILTGSAQNAKRPQSRIQAIAALGTMGSNPKAATMIRAAMKDRDLDVRTAAILAAAGTKNHALLADVHPLLNDPEPQVVFTAATTLWKEHDRAGEDILRAVADGDRKANPTLMHGARNDMNRKLHDPSSLAMTAGTAGAGMLLGPFGFGIAAVEYLRKNGGESARASAISYLGDDKSPAIREELVDALDDKEPSVRAAAAKALGQFHQSNLQEPLGKLFADPKLPVRLTAAAAYLNCTSGSATLPRTKRPGQTR